MRKMGFAFASALLLAACGGGEDALDEPEEAPIAGGEGPIPAAGEIADQADPAQSADDSGEGDEPRAAAALTTIPAKYHGVWDVPGSDCENYTDGLTEVRANEISYYESGSKVLGVRMDGKDALVDLESLPYGDDDDVSKSTSRYALMTTPQGLQLHITDASQASRESEFPLKRCEK